MKLTALTSPISPPTGGLTSIPTESYGVDNDSGAVVCKDMNNVLDDMNLSDKERLVTKSIILDIDSQIGDIIFNNGDARIPYIGTCSRPFNIKVVIKYRRELLEAARTMTKEDYADFVRKLYKREKEALKIDKQRLRRMEKFRNTYFKVYSRLYDRIGEEYANLWIYLRNKYSIVEFNPEREEEFQECYYGKE